MRYSKTNTWFISRSSKNSRREVVSRIQHRETSNFQYFPQYRLYLYNTCTLTTIPKGNASHKRCIHVECSQTVLDHVDTNLRTGQTVCYAALTVGNKTCQLRREDNTNMMKVFASLNP